jgi:hypothetical protein
MSKVPADNPVATGRKKAQKRTGKSSRNSRASGPFKPQITVVDETSLGGGIGFIGGIGPRK